MNEALTCFIAGKSAAITYMCPAHTEPTMCPHLPQDRETDHVNTSMALYNIHSASK